MRFSSSRMMLPEVAGMSCMMVRERVDFPQPDSPTSPRISPFLMDSVTPSTALTESTCFWMSKPLLTGKCVLTSWSSRNMAVICYWLKGLVFEGSRESFISSCGPRWLWLWLVFR